MAERKVNFYQGIVAGGRVTIFVPPEEFSAQNLLDVYPAECFTTPAALVLKFKTPEETIIATNKNLLEDILAGDKEVWITHLNLQFGYLLDQCRLDFSKEPAYG